MKKRQRKKLFKKKLKQELSVFEDNYPGNKLFETKMWIYNRSGFGTAFVKKEEK